MRQRKAGFTLVELLVVIGIIAVLISMLLPALGRVRHQAQVTACAARLRDTTLAVIMYANENKGALPARKGDDGAGRYTLTVGSGTNGWHFSEPAFTLGSQWHTMGDGYGLGRVYKTGYLKTLKSTYCPSAPDQPLLSDTNTRTFSLYVYNPHLAYTENGTFMTYWWKKLPTFGRGGSGTLKLTDGSTYDMPKFRRALLVEPMYGTNDLNALTHALGTKRAFNLAYSDGSVQSYVANHFTARAISNWGSFLDFSNALQHAADGGTVDWKNWQSWTNKNYNKIPAIN